MGTRGRGADSGNREESYVGAVPRYLLSATFCPARSIPGAGLRERRNSNTNLFARRTVEIEGTPTPIFLFRPLSVRKLLGSSVCRAWDST